MVWVVLDDVAPAAEQHVAALDNQASGCMAGACWVVSQRTHYGWCAAVQGLHMALSGYSTWYAHMDGVLAQVEALEPCEPDQLHRHLLQPSLRQVQCLQVGVVHGHNEQGVLPVQCIKGGYQCTPFNLEAFQL